MALPRITDKHRGFLDALKLMLDRGARLEFDYAAQVNLAISLEACGLEGYPPLAGDEQGERCSGELVCEKCQRTYYDHPADWRVIGFGNVPFLNVLCDGRRVKL